MKQRSAPKKPRGAYHHGDLSRAAQDVGASLVEQVGPSGFTLAEVAKRLGVTAAALYRHFAHREALLFAIAIESFASFGGALARAASLPASERVEAMASAYVDYALKHPARYELMFATRFVHPRPDALEAAGDAAFATLVEALGAVVPGVSEEALVALAKQAWALCHGLASLLVSGAIPRTPKQVKGLAVHGVAALLAAARHSRSDTAGPSS